MMRHFEREIPRAYGSRHRHRARTLVLPRGYGSRYRHRARTLVLALCTLAALVPIVALAAVPGQAAAPPERRAPSLAQGFQPTELVRVGRTPDVLLLGTGPCDVRGSAPGKHPGSRLCLQLWHVQHEARDLIELKAPPEQGALKFAGNTGSVGNLVFANLDDGYALASPGTGGYSSYTVDGGQSWQRLTSRLGMSLSQVVATDNAFYAVIMNCRPLSGKPGQRLCQYRLARSPLGAPHWSSVPVPGTSSLDGATISLTADGSQVWLEFQPGDKAVILKSIDGRAPFTQLDEPDLVSVASCSLSLMSPMVVWAECPTGMMVSWSRSTDGGRHFSAFWGTSGTGGDAFDPLSASVAYRYTGTGPAPSRTLERTTDGGSKFEVVARLPFDEGMGGRLAFTDEGHGYVLGWEAISGNAAETRPVLLYTSDGGHTWETVL